MGFDAPLSPEPSAVQLVPFQRATRLARTAPTREKAPATKSARPPPSSCSHSARTWKFAPSPSARRDQRVLVQRARLEVATLPAIVNEPPATSSGPWPPS